MNDMYDLEKYFWQSKTVRLRPFQPEDWELKYQEYLDSEARRFLQWGVELPKTADEYREGFVDACYFKDAKETGTVVCAIETLSNEFVGWVSLHSRDMRNGTFSLSVGIFGPYRQQGYAEEACRIMLRYGFYELRLQKCNSGCVHLNTGSMKLHKKLGFVQEGIQRRTIYTMGQYCDHVLFGMTREEFDAQEQCRTIA